MTELTLTTERTINAAPKDVFAAWLNPDLLAKFMRPNPTMPESPSKTDPVEGGRFEILMNVGDQVIPHSGTYREISPNNRIVFTWESPMSTDNSVVTLDFAPKDGGTHITLNHVRFPNQESRDNHLGGWGHILTALDSVIETASA